MARTMTIGMILHHGLMQDQGVLCAASLKHFLRFDAKVVAVVPQPPEIFGRLHPSIISILEKLDVEIVPVVNNYIKPPPKLQKVYTVRQKARFFTNKWALLEHPWDTDSILFLDSDTMCCEPFKYAEWMDHPLGLHTVGRGGVRMDREYTWQRLFDAVGAQPTTTKWRHHRFNYVGPPMFNGGLVKVDVSEAQAFCKTWREDTDTLAGILNGSHAYFAEQVALATATYKSGLDFAMRPVAERHQCMHYGTWRHVWGDPKIWRALKLLLAKHPGILKFLRSGVAANCTQQRFKKTKFPVKV